MSAFFSLLNNLFGIIGFIAGFIFGLFKFVNWLLLKLREKELEKNFGSGLFTIDVIKRSTQYYIRCDATSIDPTRQSDLSATIAVRQNIFEALNEHLLSTEPDHRYLILLADSGMGKTSFLLNYWIYNRGLSRHKRHKIYMIPLSRPDVIEKIKEVQDKQNTVIFLDAFDEDMAAINDHRTRLDELMRACLDFKRVLITCRTQFFAKEEDIPKAVNIIYAGPREPGQPGKYKFYKLYIAPFTDQQIDQYVNKRFPFWQSAKREKAKEIISHINDLRVRPMLLSYVEYFLNDGRVEYKNIYQIYKKLIDVWVEREADWISSDNLRALSKKLAFDIYSKKEELGGERLPKTALLKMAEDSKISIEERKFVHSRSLLNSDGEGNYKFAHRSIMEFLFVEYFLDLDDSQRPQIVWTDLMKQFLLEKIQSSDYAKDLLFSLYRTGFQPGDMVLIPKGSFLYGDNKIKEDIDYDYYIDGFPVTNKQYMEFLKDKPAHSLPAGNDVWNKWDETNRTFPEGMDNHPVVGVSYQDTKDFCQWRSKKEGKAYKLPTELEWEKAARGVDGGKYPWGNEFDKGKCNTSESGIGKTTPVLQYPQGISPYGCFDMVGNVWEWTDSWYDKDKDRKVLRGGSWNTNLDLARCAYRYFYNPFKRYFNIGFRCLRTS